MCIMFRRELMGLVDIEREVSVDEVLEDLQLGSVGIEVGHSGCVMYPCVVVECGREGVEFS